MKRALAYFTAACALFWSFAVAGEEPRIKPPRVDELNAIQLPDSAEVVVCAYSNSGKYTFAIFECQSSDRVCYLFRSAEIKDFVCSSSKGIDGKLEPMSHQQVLRFFVVRFRGIANDISHQKWRPDVVDEALGPLEPVGGDDAKAVGMYSLFYDGYASAMEEVLAASEK